MKRMKKSAGIAWLIAFVVIIAALAQYSLTILNDTSKDGAESLKLGLDLAGGVSITYGVVGGEATQEQLDDTISKLQQRIENDLGSESSTTEASVYQVGSNRITVEIPGVTDANALLQELGTPGTLYFIKQTDADGNPNYTFDQTYGYLLNYDIATLEAKGSIICTGKDVASAQAAYINDQVTGANEPIVSLTFSNTGREAFGTASTEAYNKGETIAIYYDGAFVSVPRVNEPITTGNCQISGMAGREEAEKLASYIRIGGLDIELEELQSEVVGAQLGSDAFASSIKAAGIGLVLVMLFLIIVYLVPGVVASVALALYTTLMIAVLYLFDITLTLPGIAGMILSIGMAVDANVIIFARIREEIAAGKTVITAIESGFKKALSAILDGNITTLIAAAVLGAIGSGSVKGFAITLAIGVILSMFTALVVTRIIMLAVYSLGITDAKFYGKAKDTKAINFISKKGVFFTCSIAVIAAGFIGMGVNAARNIGSLNYSLEFKGGTSTTVNFPQVYSLADADAVIVPEIATVIGSSDIQTQVVDSTNEIIFKTRTLNLDERTALNSMLEEKFSVTEESITSENISSTISGEMRRQSIIAVIVAAFFMLIYIWFRFKDIRFAGSAIIALVHDVLVVLALYALARISVGSAFIACMLTVIGYSVNDTIVIFDRIRENLSGVRSNKPEELKEIANVSLSQTLSRSISTSITTALMVLMLLILGVASIKEFALPLLCGVIVGTYSSICIATELWYVFKIKIASKKK